MLLHIPNVLSAAELAQCRRTLAEAPWADGRLTAGHQSVKAKDNLQLPQDCAEARALGTLVLRALERNPMFASAALPRTVFPPLFNKYENGMSFGAHVDNAIRPVPDRARRIRTDVSATLFLSAPEEYDGGELIVEDTFGTRGVKLPAGDMVLYPATSLHRVESVTRGARLAAFFWVQSMVKDDAERRLLFDLDRAVVSLGKDLPDHPALVSLTGIYHNLVRKWGEV
jgi:PKHD-type hydroxylase